MNCSEDQSPVGPVPSPGAFFNSLLASPRLPHHSTYPSAYIPIIWYPAST